MAKAYARRYSQAVFEIARERNEIDRWQSDLSRVLGVLEKADFKAWLENPKVRFDEKSRLLAERLAGVNPLAVNLVRLLITKGRLGIINKVVDEYQRLVDSYHGIDRAQVISAVPLRTEDESRLVKYLSSLVGKKIILKSEVNPNILGGIIARVNGKLFDGSTRSKLMALKKALVGAS